MYWVGRKGCDLASTRYAHAIERWGHRFRSGGRAGVLVFLSSASGLPPFYVISTLAGVFRTSFLGFVLAGTAGRFLHFLVLAFAPLLFSALAR
jgi:membrane protein YqaA with SNARE-associated domain